MARKNILWLKYSQLFSEIQEADTCRIHEKVEENAEIQSVRQIKAKMETHFWLRSKCNQRHTPISLSGQFPTALLVLPQTQTSYGEDLSSCPLAPDLSDAYPSLLDFGYLFASCQTGISEISHFQVCLTLHTASLIILLKIYRVMSSPSLQTLAAFGCSQATLDQGMFHSAPSDHHTLWYHPGSLQLYLLLSFPYILPLFWKSILILPALSLGSLC